MSVTFFNAVFPTKINAYSISNTVIVVGGGLPASMIGGYLSDKWEHRYGGIKGMTAGLGALAATPFIFITYIW